MISCETTAWGLLLGIALTALVSGRPNRGVVTLYGVFSALFHIGTTALYGAYSPGLITSLLARPLLYVYLSQPRPSPSPPPA